MIPALGAHLVQRSLAELTTLRIGGQPAAVVACSTASTLAHVVSFLDAHSVPLLVLGGGSNIVAGEGAPLAQTVVVWAQPTEEISIEEDTGLVRAYAGAHFDQLVGRTVQAGLAGLECLSGIPGSVGATPVQNVGAYGAEVSQVLKRVQLYERHSGENRQPVLRWVDPQELDLGYRYSNLKFTGRAVVTAVEFQLAAEGLSAPLRYGELSRALGSAEPQPVQRVRETVLQLRTAKGMVLDPQDHDTWSAGSFFTNPIVESEEASARVLHAIKDRCGDVEVPCYPVGQGRYKFSAAWLIDHAGFSKGWSLPGRPQASLSTKHTLALTNRGTAASADILALASAVREGVEEAFGITLEPEPVYVGVGRSGSSYQAC